MKYTVKCEIAVYEADGDMDDLLRSSVSMTINSTEEATRVGRLFQDAMVTAHAAASAKRWKEGEPWTPETARQQKGGTIGT